jgi:hypothetical protein
VNSLWIVRFFTVAVSLLYSVYYAPWNEIAMFFDRGLAIIGEGGGPYWLWRTRAAGIYISAIASIIVVFFAVPRWPAGTRILSWCFVVMGVSLLADLAEGLWVRLLPWYTQVTTYAHPLILALPPFILAAMLRLPKIETDLQPTL